MAGPSNLPPPYGATIVPVETTSELQSALEDLLPNTDVLFMAAAPADYRPVQRRTEKRVRTEGAMTLEMEPTPDVLIGTLDSRKAGAVTVGFALETSAGLDKARAKLRRKSLNLIVLNMANEPGTGFETPTNRVTIVSETGETELPLMSKRAVAEQILDETESLL